MKSSEADLVIPVGPLNSLSSLIYFLARPLADLSQRYARGMTVHPVFDLSSIEPRRQSMAALSAFLSISERLAKFMGRPVPVLLDWNPAVLSFWHDIQFLQIAQSLSVLDFPTNLVGGYTPGLTNPNTRLIRYDLPPEDPVPDLRNTSALRVWKDRNRLVLSNDLAFLCNHIFQPRRSRAIMSDRIRGIIAATAAELALNSLMHGHAPAYVGVQRTHSSITVAVCDCGDGFPKSLSRHPSYSAAVMKRPPSDAQSLLFASLMNKSEMGLRRAIAEIADSGGQFEGSILMSSYNAEIQWKRDLWIRALDSLHDLGGSPAELDAETLLGSHIEGTPSYEVRHAGLYRIWRPGLRGTRISFEIRMPTHNA